MTRIEFWEPAGTFDVPGKGEFSQVFTSHAFDGVTGKRVPVRVQPGGRQAGWCTVIAVVVDEDGGGATWTVEVEDGPVTEAARRTEGMSFAFREPAELPRDPLAVGELQVRWREGAARPAAGDQGI